MDLNTIVECAYAPCSKKFIYLPGYPTYWFDTFFLHWCSWDCSDNWAIDRCINIKTNKDN